MELRGLISQTQDLREQIKQLHAQKSGLEERLKTLEKQIKEKLDETGEDYENLSEEEFQLLMEKLGDPMQLTVEVVFANDEKQIIREVQLPRNATIEDGIILSGILDKCPEVDLDQNKVGIFGQIKPITERLNDGDRIEIYRPVTAKS
jgi:putative ubiquitin-RnfH superfamily antitoxin RatB of RatAB toxin-antitoxin module